MLKISSSSLISIANKLLIIFLIAKGLSLVALWYLPNDGVELNLQKNYQPLYQRVDFKNMLINQDKTSQQSTIKIQDTSMSNMILKGLYGTKTKGFIIIAMKSNSKKTSIIGIGELYQGFKLIKIKPKSAVFIKDSKKYILELKKIKKGSIITKIKPKVLKEKLTKPILISKTEIANYVANPTQMWKEISISEVKNGKKLKGFKVNSIVKNSRFATLGLKKGDIIIKANNIALKSYNDVMSIYNNISKLKILQIVLLRENKEKELIYEID